MLCTPYHSCCRRSGDAKLSDRICIASNFPAFSLTPRVSPKPYSTQNTIMIIPARDLMYILASRAVRGVRDSQVMIKGWTNRVPMYVRTELG